MGTAKAKAKDDISARLVKPKKQEQDDSISLNEDVYVETEKEFRCDICDLTYENED